MQGDTRINTATVQSETSGIKLKHKNVRLKVLPAAHYSSTVCTSGRTGGCMYRIFMSKILYIQTSTVQYALSLVHWQWVPCALVPCLYTQTTVADLPQLVQVLLFYT
jgi:hypothetical protein